MVERLQSSAASNAQQSVVLYTVILLPSCSYLLSTSLTPLSVHDSNCLDDDGMSRRVRVRTDDQRVASRVHARQRRARLSGEQKQAERDRARQRRALMTDEQIDAERQRARDRKRARPPQPRSLAAPVTVSPLSFVPMAPRTPSPLTSSGRCLSVVRMRDAAHCASPERRRDRCAATVARRCYLPSLPCQRSCTGCTSGAMRSYLLSPLPYPLLSLIYWTTPPSAATSATTYVVRQRHGAGVTNVQSGGDTRSRSAHHQGAWTNASPPACLPCTRCAAGPCC